MKNGLMTIEKTDESMRAVFIDQEVVEFAKLNIRIQNRIRKQKQEYAKAERSKKSMKKMANRIITEAIFGTAVAVGGSLGLIHPLVGIPVAIISLCVACIHFGAYITKKK